MSISAPIVNFRPILLYRVRVACGAFLNAYFNASLFMSPHKLPPSVTLKSYLIPVAAKRIDCLLDNLDLISVAAIGPDETS